MPGFENNIVFANGMKLQSSTADDISRMQESGTDVSRINFIGNPEGVISANPGSLCHDPVSGNIYYKQSGSSINGWLILNSSPSINWTDIITPTQALSVQSGYVTDNAGGVTYTLPATAALGQFFTIIGKSGITTIAQNANQQILIGVQSSTVGITGSVSGTDISDCATFTCIVSGTSTVWRASPIDGNWTVS